MASNPDQSPKIGGDVPDPSGKGSVPAESIVGVPIGAADRVAHPGKAERVAAGEEGEEPDTTSDPETMKVATPKASDPLADGGLKDKAAQESDARANAVGATERVQPNQPGKPAR